MATLERIGGLLFLAAFVVLTCGQTSHPPELQDCTDPACGRMNSTGGLPGAGNAHPPPVGASAEVGGAAGQTGATTTVGGVGGSLGGFGGMTESGLGGGGFTGGGAGSTTFAAGTGGAGGGP